MDIICFQSLVSYEKDKGLFTILLKKPPQKNLFPIKHSKRLSNPKLFFKYFQ